MNQWTVDEALAWAETYPPLSSDSMALDALAQEVHRLRRELSKANAWIVVWTTKHQPEETK